ncbi:thiazole synthase [Formicincola oecophyllae]|uniref:thiazole synthase n=1 Tax=Formicincola oecophyllae TaxID=2558361 RepID=A0A4Y6UB48_9PROT|nr:thiazole synthase [Formicincola oecophyllae]QDH13686.1 thiazole synthase [Formicincola oecophyllae]
MTLHVYGQPCQSRLFLGTARYPSPASLGQAVEEAKPGFITVSLRREAIGMGRKAKSPHAYQGSHGFQGLLKAMGVPVLPNTAGCLSVSEAMTTAHMGRELFQTPLVKLEVIRDETTLQPDLPGLMEAARLLCAEGFHVLPYCTTDLSVADKLMQAGCTILMPGASPIGAGQGIHDPAAMKRLRACFPETILVADAGLRVPSQAAALMEWGYDAILVNTAVARAENPPLMARAFAKAVKAGRMAFKAGPTLEREEAVPSTPMAGRAFTDDTQPWRESAHAPA